MDYGRAEAVSLTVKLTSGENEPLLIRWNTLLILYFAFQPGYRVDRLYHNRKGLSCKGFDEDLEASSAASTRKGPARRLRLLEGSDLDLDAASCIRSGDLRLDRVTASKRHGNKLADSAVGVGYSV